jgi:hypothetical protein
VNVLRAFIREVLRDVRLREGGPGATVSVDPTKSTRPYDYDIPRGTDVHAFWYRSPGRPVGGDGDPGRPPDAADYIGMKHDEESDSGGESDSEV